MLRTLYRTLSPRWQALFLDYPVDLRPRKTPDQPGWGAVAAAIEARRSDIEAWVDCLSARASALQEIRPEGQETEAAAPRWNNGFLPGLDMAALHTVLAERRPRRYVEVGSGNSTKLAAWTARREGFQMDITSVDPFPRAEVDGLVDHAVRTPFEAVDEGVWRQLEAGDVLFVDNSHRSLPNSDVTALFMEVLPALPAGVLVHIHDVYLPWDYPQDMCHRGYNEQYLLAVAIAAAPERYRPMLPAFWVSEQADLAARLEGIWAHPNTSGVERHGGSFWLELGPVSAPQ